MKSDLRERLQALRDNLIPSAELPRLIHEFGEADFREAEKDVAAFLGSDSPFLRYAAINVLGIHWNLRGYEDSFEQILVTDPDTNVRRVAAASLGAVLEGSGEPRAACILAEKVRDETEDWYVRDAAYYGLLTIWFPVAVYERDWAPRRAQASRTDSSILAEIGKARERGEDTDALWEKLVDAWTASIDWKTVAEIERAAGCTK